MSGYAAKEDGASSICIAPSRLLSSSLSPPLSPSLPPTNARTSEPSTSTATSTSSTTSSYSPSLTSTSFLITPPSSPPRPRFEDGHDDNVDDVDDAKNQPRLSKTSTPPSQPKSFPSREKEHAAQLGPVAAPPFLVIVLRDWFLTPFLQGFTLGIVGHFYTMLKIKRPLRGLVTSFRKTKEVAAAVPAAPAAVRIVVD